MTKVLSVASECVPLVKTGGLADVVGALPQALAGEGIDMRVLMPGYRGVLKALKRPKEVFAEDDLFGGPARLLFGKAAGLELYAIDAPHLFDRDGSLYMDPGGRDWADNPMRFAALGWMAARIGAGAVKGWQPGILHLHDWQAGLAPVYLRDVMEVTGVGTLLTIHNIAFAGNAQPHLVDRLRLPSAGFSREGFEFWGQISTLKAGLVWADKINTVSPSYAGELMTPELGMGFDGLIRARQADVSGILNGIDTGVWDPMQADFAYKSPAGKKKNTTALRKELGLPPTRGPLCVLVSRLTHQKGIDLLVDALPALVDRGGQLAVLGSGDRTLEAALTSAAEDHPHVSVTIGYDEALSHRMIAGGDAVLVPSRFEPCGLTQLYGLRYGALPVVAYTGGLIDTVIPATAAGQAAGVATGFQFHPATSDAFARTLIRVCEAFQDKPGWTRMQRNAMRHPVGWDNSAKEYAALYAEIAAK